jgi:hypothetical protein
VRPFENVTHQELGLGPRDQDPPVDGQIQVAETRPADDVRHRLGVQPAPDACPVPLELVGPDRAVIAQVEIEPSGAEDVGQEVLRGEPGLGDAALLEELGGRPEEREYRPPPCGLGTANA